jgi:hypothetical protein
MPKDPILTDEVGEVFVVCDHNKLEVVLLTPGSHHSTQRVRQAGAVLCRRTGRQTGRQEGNAWQFAYCKVRQLVD